MAMNFRFHYKLKAHEFQTSVAPETVEEPAPIHQEEKFQIKEKEIAAVAPESEWEKADQALENETSRCNGSNGSDG